MTLLLIFGTRGITYTKASGDFQCPSCGPARYRHRRIRNFFTLYFIPLIPLNMEREFVECAQCRQTFRLEILQLGIGDTGGGGIG